MAVQLTPVLYNTRYASYFIEPWLMVLTGLSVAYIIAMPLAIRPRWAWPMRIVLLALPVLVAHALTARAIRREDWHFDPARPGPTEVLIPARLLALSHATGMTKQPDGQWRITGKPASLHMPVQESWINHSPLRDPMWRLRLGLTTPGKQSSSCAKVMLGVTPFHPPKEPTFLPNQLQVIGDGQLRMHMLAAPHLPQGQAMLSITFNCPAGSLVNWQGIELRHSTLPEAARDLQTTGKPLQPYLNEPL